MVLEDSNVEGRKIELYRETPDTLTVSVISKGRFVFYDRLNHYQVHDLIQYLSAELGRMPK